MDQKQLRQAAAAVGLAIAAIWAVATLAPASVPQRSQYAQQRAPFDIGSSYRLDTRTGQILNCGAASGCTAAVPVDDVFNEAGSQREVAGRGGSDS